ncbi:hypothetical protein V8E54_010181 [Elaphomyces granulatus]
MTPRTLPSTSSLWALLAILVQIVDARVSDAPGNGTQSNSGDSGDSGDSSGTSTGSNNNGSQGLTQQDQIAIGVVAGVVSLALIIFTIFILLRTRRKRKRRSQGFETASTPHASLRDRPRSVQPRHLSLRQQPRCSTHSGTSAKTPAQSYYPYDPSKYQEEYPFGPSQEHSASHGYHPDSIAMTYSSVQRQPSLRSYQNPPPYQADPHTSSQQPSYINAEQVTPPGAGSGTTEAQPVAESGSRPPRRPKPVLSKLITNL